MRGAPRNNTVVGTEPVYRETSIRSCRGRIALSVWTVPSSRATVVFVPGTGVHPLFYRSFLEQLAASGFTVVGVHPQGHGLSPGYKGDLRFAHLIINALDACRWAQSPVVLMGSSQGSLVALLAAAAGAPVRGVIAHNVFDPGGDSATAVTRLAGVRHVRRPLVAAVRALAVVAPRLPLPVYAYLDPARVFVSAETRRAYEQDPLCRRSYPARFLADLFTVDTSGLYDGRIRVPVVVLTASADPLFDIEETRQLTARLTAPSVTLVELDSDAHLILNDQVDASVDVVVKALDAIV